MIRLLIAALAALLLLAPTAGAQLPPLPTAPPAVPPAPALPGTSAADPAPYGADDAGGFRSVLPPGEAGVDNAADLAAFTATGKRPPHWDDQSPLYDGLLYASPTLTHDQIGDYFKDATFGIKPGDVASTTSPRPGSLAAVEALT